MQPGTYKALTDLTIRRMQSNSIGAIFHEPRTVETFAYRAGETFEIPATANGYYFAGGITAEESTSLADGFGLSEPANVERIDPADVERVD